jgi:hypothetical protein
MSDRADLFVARVARLKSIPEGVCTSEILNSYNELVSEARAIISVDGLHGRIFRVKCSMWDDSDVCSESGLRCQNSCGRCVVVKEGPPLPAGTLMADSFEVIEDSALETIGKPSGIDVCSD